MTAERRRELRRLEGSTVSLALADGSRLDDVSLVSAHGLTLWIFDSGEDVFVPVSKVIDFWPGSRVGSAA
ncbi:MAG TPA: hypothetical protein VHF27_12470 [Acidimicrobiales bacterium]|nr:hypothetical protein [Acidimicrobiales bacterium]